jgi:hypothetical protein
VARTGARATSSVVIIAGAALTALLVYALATELGSSVSPFFELNWNTQAMITDQTNLSVSYNSNISCLNRFMHD